MGVNQRAQIRMSDDEVASFLRQSRTATVATIGPGGFPHLVAMWYGLSPDGQVEAGESYDQLRGVAIEGSAVIIEDTSSERYWAAAVSIFERYQGPYTDDLRPFLEQMMNKRIVVAIAPVRVRSWDHRKLGMAALPVAGSTARYL
jgi:hypothetical protein